MIPFDALKNLADAYIKKTRQRNNWSLIRFLHSISFLKKARIYLKDLDIPISFDLVEGIKKSNFSKKSADIITDSDSLAFIFSWDYGANTLMVNGRYRTSGGNITNFYHLFYLGILNNTGRTFNFVTCIELLRQKFMKIADLG